MNQVFPLKSEPMAVSSESARVFFRLESHQLALGPRKVKDSYYQNHFSLSKGAIEEAIKALDGVALVLGSGACNDLPLEKLVSRFKRVVFVDVDPLYTKRAIEELPQQLQEKCTIESADLTGFFDAFSLAVEEIAKKKPPFDDFVSEIVKLPPTLKRKNFEYQKGAFSFVCSSMLSSQLMSGIGNYLQEISKQYYDKTFLVPPDKEKSFTDWMTQIQVNHIEELRNLLEEKGRAYFADHFSARGYVNVSSVVEETEIELGKMDFSGAKEVQERIGKLFSVISNQQWTWTLPIGTFTGKAAETDEKGAPVRIVETQEEEFREYQVTSLYLTPIKV